MQIYKSNISPGHQIDPFKMSHIYLAKTSTKKTHISARCEPEYPRTIKKITGFWTIMDKNSHHLHKTLVRAI
jgi:hypothetical protein